MIAEIISIGTEITTGSILNTNTKYLSEKLMELGIDVFYHTSVDDNKDRLSQVLNIALNRADIIITTGGLGPTEDDLTKEVISNTLGLELEMDHIMENNIMAMFKDKDRPMSDNNRKQAKKPKGSSFITNDYGTAPGIYIDLDRKKILMLPGPPHELIPMFENYVYPIIKEDYSILSRSINIYGIGESSLESRLKELPIWNYNNIIVATFAKAGQIEIKIIGKGKIKELVEKQIHEIMKIIILEFNEYIFGYDNILIEEVVFKMLHEGKLRLGLAESCTGGLISSKFTRIPGASDVLDRAIVSYSNLSKIEELGVDKEILKLYGAVSSETAFAMAKGLMTRTNLDICLSITGIAGPGGGTTDKPIGLVYLCIMSRDKHKVIKCHFNGNRATIQNRAATRAFIEIRKFLSE